jgi:hypothetical protein
MAQPVENTSKSCEMTSRQCKTDADKWPLAYARSFEPFAMARASIILAMLLLLKSHLKTAYGLSEE